MEEIIVNLIVPFIALVLLTTLIDRAILVLEGIMKKIPKLPNNFEWPFAYIFVLIVGYFICKELNFGIFSYLGLEANHKQADWLLTAFIISGGSTFIRTQFEMMNEIPSFLNGITASIKKVVKK